MARGRHSFFVTCAPGVEPALHAEMRALRLAKVERQVGGVYFEGTLADAGRANLWLRAAVRVLLRVTRFACGDEDALYRGAHEVEWERFLAPEGTLAVTAHARDSELFHTGFVAQRVKDAVADRFREQSGKRPSVDKDDPVLGIHAHLVKNRCTLLADTTGPSLHKRGWRRAQGRAPLAETLAAATLHFSGWDKRSPLLDSFCGSGTILVEAALLASGRAPGAFRERFAFERWPGHDARAWQAARNEARDAGATPRRLILRGSDVDPARIEDARANAEAAGVADAIALEVADARDFAPKPGWNAWIATNPPYGERVGREKELVAVYRAFGDRLREHCAGYRLALFAGNRRLASELGIEPDERIALRNGALECELLLAEL